ncbi:MAG: LysR family transcriptional regulator [Proteobacteria bacterium]|nr:LysR family transcriptional regulator [Pseudomonadota bacterium]MBU1583458.1 LysR family transcriptional regulator [Pseudomonadota bacterium]MBU2452737.1 LysR family transcriptional regulator [Pseudomonadota bacterium]MBU2631610.1 LysR family transcriptional regulator [Pseudomonadota bacterium]
MEFRQLKTFRALADNLNFTKTAERLFMAQSSVSAQIKALEDELEIKLFDRIGRRVLLTDAGRKLYDYARRMEDMTAEIHSEMSGNKYSRGSLTIRVPETLASCYMPQIINRFHRVNPKVNLIFINCTDQQLREELNTGRIDLAFLMTDEIYLKDVTVRMLKTEKLQLVASPLHPLANMKKITLEDLDKQTVLLPKTD